jgi:hypothetical protein
VISGGVLYIKNKKPDRLYVEQMNIWHLKYILSKNKAKRLIFGHWEFFSMSYFMAKRHLRARNPNISKNSLEKFEYFSSPI